MDRGVSFSRTRPVRRAYVCTLRVFYGFQIPSTEHDNLPEPGNRSRISFFRCYSKNDNDPRENVNGFLCLKINKLSSFETKGKIVYQKV